MYLKFARALPGAFLPALFVVSAAAQQQDRAGAGPMEAYTETVPGTLVSFEMVPVPAGRVKVEAAGGAEVAVGPVWMSRTEVLWDLYDVWVFGMDQGGQVATGKG